MKKLVQFYLVPLMNYEYSFIWSSLKLMSAVSLSPSIYRAEPNIIAIIFMKGTKYGCNDNHNEDHI